MGRKSAIRALARRLGFTRVGYRVENVLAHDITTAVTRGILERDEHGDLRLAFRSLAECTRDSLKSVFLTAIGSAWHERDDAIRAAATYVGIQRIGPIVRRQFAAVINGLIRQGRLEASGSRVRRLRP